MAEPLTKAAVVSAAREMIESDGLAALSLRKLAAELGVTAPALYAHVGSKADLLRSVAEVAFAELIDRFHLVDGDGPLERIKLMSFGYVDFAREHPELFRTLFLYRPVLTPQPRGDEFAMATEAFAIAVQPVHEAAEAGLLRGPDPLTAGLAIWAAVHGVATVILGGSDLGRETEDLMLTTVVDSILRGLSHPA